MKEQRDFCNRILAHYVGARGWFLGVRSCRAIETRGKRERKEGVGEDRHRPPHFCSLPVVQHRRGEGSCWMSRPDRRAAARQEKPDHPRDWSASKYNQSLSIPRSCIPSYVVTGRHLTTHTESRPIIQSIYRHSLPFSNYVYFIWDDRLPFLIKFIFVDHSVFKNSVSKMEVVLDNFSLFLLGPHI